MKHASAFLLVSIALLLFASQDAFAHGSVYRGPRSDVPPRMHEPADPQPPRPPAMACDCASPTCPHCAESTLAAGAGMKPVRVRRRVLARWGDLARVRIEMWFEAKAEGLRSEAYHHLGRGTLLAVTKSTLLGAEGLLDGRLAFSRSARRDYLWERYYRPRRRRDPLLVLASRDGGVHVRVFPVRRGLPTYVVLEGYTLADPVAKPGVRMYVTKAAGQAPRYAAVLPEALLPEGLVADHVDAATGRAVSFLNEAQARGYFGVAVDGARHVPCIPELASTALGEGERAVNARTALLAMPAGLGAPRGVRVRAPQQP